MVDDYAEGNHLSIAASLTHAIGHIHSMLSQQVHTL